MLRRLPGVTQYNLPAILHKVDSVAELFQLSLPEVRQSVCCESSHEKGSGAGGSRKGVAQMTAIMGGPQATALHEFLSKRL